MASIVHRHPLPVQEETVGDVGGLLVCLVRGDVISIGVVLGRAQAEDHAAGIVLRTNGIYLRNYQLTQISLGLGKSNTWNRIA